MKLAEGKWRIITTITSGNSPRDVSACNTTSQFQIPKETSTSISEVQHILLRHHGREPVPDNAKRGKNAQRRFMNANDSSRSRTYKFRQNF